jgi:hypothetical protein
VALGLGLLATASSHFSHTDVELAGMDAIRWNASVARAFSCALKAEIGCWLVRKSDGHGAMVPVNL